MPIPPVSKLREPVLQAIRELGGEATNKQISAHVGKMLNLSTEELEQKHTGDGRTEFDYRLAWARTHLSKAGSIERRGAGRWALAEK